MDNRQANTPKISQPKMSTAEKLRLCSLLCLEGADKEVILQQPADINGKVLLEAAICLHDGFNIQSVRKALEDGITEKNLYELRINGLIHQQEDSEPILSSDERMELQKISEGMVQILEWINQVKQQDRIEQAASALPAATIPNTGKRRWFDFRMRKLKKIMENLSEEQQYIVLEAINNGIPIESIPDLVLAKSPKVMRLMAATLLKLQQQPPKEKKAWTWKRKKPKRQSETDKEVSKSENTSEAVCQEVPVEQSEGNGENVGNINTGKKEEQQNE